MTYVRGIVACGLSGVLLAGCWFAAVGLTLGASPHSHEYVAEPSQKVFHDPDADCIYLPPAKPLLHFHCEADAEEFGNPCPHCLSELAGRSRRASIARQP